MADDKTEDTLSETLLLHYTGSAGLGFLVDVTLAIVTDTSPGDLPDDETTHYMVSVASMTPGNCQHVCTRQTTTRSFCHDLSYAQQLTALLVAGMTRDGAIFERVDL